MCLSKLHLKEEQTSQKWLFVHSVKMYRVVSNVPGYGGLSIINNKVSMEKCIISISVKKIF